MYVCIIYTCVFHDHKHMDSHGGQEKEPDTLKPYLTVDYELPGVSIGNQTHVFCQSSKHT